MKLHTRHLPFYFLFARLLFTAALPLEGLRGYGDLQHFFNLAALGWPYFDFWVEFPPLFPFFSRLLYLLAGGQQHVYDYLLVISLSLAQAGGLALFLRLDGLLYGGEGRPGSRLLYFLLTLCLAYGWWYFDPLPVLFMLLGLCWLFEGRDVPAGLALAAGALTKLFPLLALSAAWYRLPPRRALRATAAALGVTALVYALLYVASPEMTLASLGSQAGKGSWETVWALLDGNLGTGNFGPLAERFDPAAALQPQGNPPVVPPWLTLILAGLLGLGLYLRLPRGGPRSAAAFLGMAWCIFLLWSPGWSPQWVLYLLPLIMLVLPEKLGSLMAVTFVLVNLLEWPLLLSRSLNWGLWLTVPLRSLLLVLLAALFWDSLRRFTPHPSVEAD